MRDRTSEIYNLFIPESDHNYAEALCYTFTVLYLELQSNCIYIYIYINSVSPLTLYFKWPLQGDMNARFVGLNWKLRGVL